MQPTITVIERPEPHMREAMVRPLIAFNNSRASQPENYRPVVIILSDPDTGEIIDGLWGETNFAHLHVDLLFVPETCEASVSADKCCFRRNKKRKLVAVEAHGWIPTAFRRAGSTSG
jgi:hypothetical protein